MLKNILIVLAIAIAAFLIYVSTKPDTFSVERSTVINASADKVFPLINDMPAAISWNPFIKIDPNVKGSFSGPGAGPGAKYSFVGNNNVGTGSIEITASRADESVSMRLIMIEPMAADNAVKFTLMPEGNATRVSWTMTGRVPYVGKIMHMIINMDKMIGGNFATGLADLKVMAEKVVPGK